MPAVGQHMPNVVWPGPVSRYAHAALEAYEHASLCTGLPESMQCRSGGARRVPACSKTRQTLLVSCKTDSTLSLVDSCRPSSASCQVV